MSRRVLVLFLSVLMLLSCAVPAAFADEGIDTWEVDPSFDETPLDVTEIPIGGEDAFVIDAPAEDPVPEEEILDPAAPETTEPAGTDLSEEELFGASAEDPFAFGNDPQTAEDPEAEESDEAEGPVDFEFGYSDFLDFAFGDAANATTYYYNDPTNDTGPWYTIPSNGKTYILKGVVLRNSSGAEVSGEIMTKGTIYGSSAYYSGFVKEGKAYFTATKAGSFWVSVQNANYVTYYHIIATFTDVALSEYYAHPVYWAQNKNITSGTSNSEFSPYNNCTRAQFVTFLWKFAGSPAPASSVNPFKDVRPDNYFYSAVLWAYHRGITSGTSPTTFSPNNPCMREQCVTFLWKYAGSPYASPYSGFNDVPSTVYFAQAVTWARTRGITSGMSDTIFGVGQPCKRGQIMTFLWKYAGSPGIFS